MNYSAFSLGIRGTVFPEGEPENLVPVHEKWIRDALIDLQQKVECLRLLHKDYYPQSEVLYSCGASVFDAPKGFIKGLWTVTTGEHCNKVHYLPVSKEEMECLLVDSACCNGQEPYPFYEVDGEYVAYPELPYGQLYSDAYSDKSSRASCGYFTVFDGQVWIYPHINSDETAVIEWEGIKRDWDDTEDVEFDREAELSVEYWLEFQEARKVNGDTDGFLTSKKLYDEQVGKLIWQCKKERRLPSKRPCFSGGCGTSWCGSICSSSSSSASGAVATLSNVNTVDTIPDLRELSGDRLSGGVFVLGMDVKYDGQGGLYAYDSANTDADDGVSTVAPNVGSGRWKKLL